MGQEWWAVGRENADEPLKDNIRWLISYFQPTTSSDLPERSRDSGPGVFGQVRTVKDAKFAR
jgi:hypothetical protein